MESPHPRGILGFMPNVTRILSQIESGNPSAAEKLLPLVYDELRKLATKPGAGLAWRLVFKNLPDVTAVAEAVGSVNTPVMGGA